MGDQIIRLQNVLALFKAETTEGADAAPVVADAFPFEVDSLTIGSPYTTQDSNESTGGEIAGLPIVVGQPVPVKMTVRLKGAGPGATYSASVKPPMHALLQSCGLKGLFTAGVAAAALTAGTATSATLGTGFGTTAQMYRGQRLVLTGAPAAGALPTISDYTAGKVATLVDIFGSALSVSNTAQILPNWTYAATTPADGTARTTDQPSGTLYAYHDGILRKLLGFRGTAKIMGETAKPGMVEIEGTAIWGGRTDVSMPTGAAIPVHAAPLLEMYAGVSPAFLINRKNLPISQFTYDWARTVETFEDPNTPAGFSAAQLMGRAPLLTCDPLTTRLVTRNHLNDLETGGGPYVGGARWGTVSGNRVALTLPSLYPVSWDEAQRKGAMAENISFRATSPGVDGSGRDADAIIVFD